MIFQTMTSLTYAVLLSTESLSLSEKQHGPIQRQWPWVSWLVCGSTATNPSSPRRAQSSPRRGQSFPRRAQSPSVSGFVMALPATEPYLPQSWDGLFGGCVNASDLCWPKLSVAHTANPQKIQPVYFMTWSRMAKESHKVRSVTY